MTTDDAIGDTAYLLDLRCECGAQLVLPRSGYWDHASPWCPSAPATLPQERYSDDDGDERDACGDLAECPACGAPAGVDCDGLCALAPEEEYR